ncbi:MAG: hypothetical protein GQ574_19440 [Crocinitomix sp.]|nr:hypothetical protein [Crocinitomix sp.]
MKSNLLIIALFLSIVGDSQTVHNWVNVQYDPSEASEVSFVDFLVLNGSVQSFHEIQEIIGAAKEKSIVHVAVELQRNGFLKRVHKTLADSSESINEFTYLGAAGSYQQHWISIFNFGVRKDTVQDAFYSGDQKDWQIRADTLAYDSEENIIYFRNKRDEVYTTFDQYGRKVKDSIPSHPKLMAHEISYKYSKKKIVKLESYPNQKIEIKTTYWLDKQGNWTKCMIQSNGRIKNAMLRRELSYFD